MFSFFIVVMAIIALCQVSCGPQTHEKSEAEKTFEGNHELRKFKVSTIEGTKWRASYFLIAGSASGTTFEEQQVTFSWQMNDSSYAISKLPLSKVRVKLDSTVKVPYIKFQWASYFRHWDLMYSINYIVVHCREEDFPAEVHISDL